MQNPRNTFLRRSRSTISAWQLLLAGVVGLAIGGTAVAGGGPENVLVVVNEASASSKLIANHYVRLRNIPPRNVVYVSGIPDRESTSFEIFASKILIPVLANLKLRGIQNSIDYIVYSADFPTSITVQPHREKLLEQVRREANKPADAPVPTAKLYNPTASINSLTYFAIAALANEPGYMTLNSNSYYRGPARDILRTPFLGERQQQYQQAVAAFRKGPGTEFDEAIVQLQQLATANPSQTAVLYQLARFYAVRGDVEAAVKWLSRAVQNGWVYRSETKKDKAFENVRFNPLYRGLEERIEDRPFQTTPSRGFKHQRRWGLNGMVNNEPQQGNNLFLSTVLAVTRNLGTTEQQALDQLTASVAADGSNPQGTFYFSVGKGVRNTTRKSQIKPTIKLLKALGKRAVTTKTNLPEGADDIVGLFTGASEFDVEETGNQIVPGAICDHLTSFGARLSAPSQTKLSEFIRNGAAGASGTVVEPYAIAAKFPHAMIHVHYARGCSLAESFYQSVAGPFQLLIVGDALCQPYAVKPTVVVNGLLPAQTVKGEVTIEFDASGAPRPVSSLELYVDGVLLYRDYELKSLTFDSAKLTDGDHELRAVVVSNDLIETTGHAVVPFSVNNHDHKIEITAKRERWSEDGLVRFEVKTNFGQTVDVIQNFRSIAGQKPLAGDGTPISFLVPARTLGRGPVQVFAQAKSTETGLVINSRPLQIFIDGVIQTTRRNTEKPRPKKPKK